MIKLRPNINLKLQTFDELINKSKTNTLHTLDWFADDVKSDLLNFTTERESLRVLKELEVFKENLENVHGEKFNEQLFYREVIDHALDLKAGIARKLKVINVMRSYRHEGELANVAAYDKLVTRLEGESAAQFSSDEFIMRYIKYDKNTDTFKKYPLLWSLPLTKGSWFRVIKSVSDTVPPVQIAQKLSLLGQFYRNITKNQKFEKYLVKPVFVPIFGTGFVESWLGYGGKYFFIGCNSKTGTAIYQLVRDNDELGTLFIYKSFDNRRWLVGATVNSEIALLQSSDSSSNRFIYSSPDMTWSLIEDNKLKKESIFSSSKVHSKEVSNDVEMALADQALSRRTKGSEIQARIRTLTEGSDLFYAFVHRMLSDEESLTVGKLHLSEVQSIGVFCDQIDCPLPDELQKCLRQELVESENRKHIFAKIMVIFYSPVVLYVIGGCSLVMYYPTIRTYAAAWFLRGVINGLIPPSFCLGCGMAYFYLGWRASIGVLSGLASFQALSSYAVFYFTEFDQDFTLLKYILCYAIIVCCLIAFFVARSIWKTM